MNPNAPDVEGGVRPRDFALLLLASRDLAPRKRARDQQADRAGLELKKRVLTALVTFLFNRFAFGQGLIRSIIYGFLEGAFFAWLAIVATRNEVARRRGDGPQ